MNTNASADVRALLAALLETEHDDKLELENARAAAELRDFERIVESTRAYHEGCERRGRCGTERRLRGGGGGGGERLEVVENALGHGDHHNSGRGVGHPHTDECGASAEAEEHEAGVHVLAAGDEEDLEGHALVQVVALDGLGQDEGAEHEHDNVVRVEARDLLRVHDLQKREQGQRQQRRDGDGHGLEDPPEGHPHQSSEHDGDLVRIRLHRLAACARGSRRQVHYHGAHGARQNLAVPPAHVPAHRNAHAIDNASIGLRSAQLRAALVVRASIVQQRGPDGIHHRDAILVLCRILTGFLPSTSLGCQRFV